MLYSTGAVEKKRVSWVLRREVCTWFCFATCTHNRNEGKHRVGGRWTSFQENTCLKNRKKAASQPWQPHTGQLKQTAGGAESRPGLEERLATCVQWWYLDLNSWLFIPRCPNHIQSMTPPFLFSPPSSRKYNNIVMASRLFLTAISSSHFAPQGQSFFSSKNRDGLVRSFI